MDINFSPDSITINDEFASSEGTSKRCSLDDEVIELPDLIDHHHQLANYDKMDADKTTMAIPFHFKTEEQTMLDEFGTIEQLSGECQTSLENINYFEKMAANQIIPKAPPKECLICGYPTTCLHYEAPSCHACKTFYRRSVLSGSLYTCKLQAKCNIKNGARCRSCRYDQCFRAGMDPESIRFVSEPSPHHLAAIQMAKQRQKDLLEGNEQWIKKEEIQIKFLPQFEQTTDSRAVELLSRLELKYDRLRESTYTAEEFYNSSIRELLRSTCQFGNAEKYGRTQDWPAYLNCQENANKPRRNWFVFDLILNLEYLKSMPFFYELDIEDQEAQVMHIVMVNTVLSEAWFSYKHNFKTKIMPDGSLPITMRKNFNVDKFYENVEPIELDTFNNNIDPLYRVEPSTEEYFLLKAIIFSHPDTPGLSAHGKEVLEAHRQLFVSALMRRVQARMGTVEGARKYADLINLIQTYFHFGQKHREFQVFVKYVCERANIPRKLPSLTDWFIKNSSKFD